MKITSVQFSPRYRYIPVQGWESVCAAIQLYDSYTTISVKEDVETFNLLEKLAIVKIPSNSNVTKILEKAKKYLQTHDQWDNDGQDMFYKTSVHIDVLDRASDMYAVGFWKAYHDDEVEVAFAATIHLERALMYSQVICTIEPVGDTFTFDFEKILRKLDSALNIQHIQGKQIVDHLKKIDALSVISIAFPLYETEDFCISISPDTMTLPKRFFYQHGCHDTWKLSKATLSGNIKVFEGIRYDPGFTLSLVSKENYDDTNRHKPIWQPEKKKQANALMIEMKQALAN